MALITASTLHPHNSAATVGTTQHDIPLLLVAFRARSTHKKHPDPACSSTRDYDHLRTENPARSAQSERDQRPITVGRSASRTVCARHTALRTFRCCAKIARRMSDPSSQPSVPRAIWIDGAAAADSY